MKTLTGGCHCRAVTFEVDVEFPDALVCWRCNCSICEMRQNLHFVVPESQFRLEGKANESLSLYTFNTHTAKHMFCSICGISCFYRPRSNPDGIAITIYCLNGYGSANQGFQYVVKDYDGKNWERGFASTGIANCSKPSKALAVPSSQGGGGGGAPAGVGTVSDVPGHPRVHCRPLSSGCVLTDMDTRSTSDVKIVHFLRHGEGEHNAAEDRLRESFLSQGLPPDEARQRGYEAYNSELYIDAELNETGRTQARAAGLSLAERGANVQVSVSWLTY